MSILMQRLFNQTETKTADFAFIGGGTSATSDIYALLDELEKRGLSNITIEVFEKDDRLGSGKAWSSKQHQALTANDPHLGMIMFAKNPKRFYEWYQSNLLRLKKTYPHLRDRLNTNTQGPDRFALRFILGEYAEEEFRDMIKRANKIGIKIKTNTRTEIVDAQCACNETWHLRSQNNQIFKAKNLKLARGPLPSDTYTTLHDQQNYHPDALDEEELKKITSDEDVVIMGSGLTAIDCAKTLIESGHRGKIYFVSRNGRLPSVKDRPDGQVRRLKFLTPENLDKKDLKLDEVLALLTQEIALASGKSVETEKMMKTAREFGSDPIATLEKELKSVESGQVRPWSWIMGEIYFDVLPILGHHLSAADRGRFMNQIMSIYLRWMAGMTEDNAKRMLKLLKTGQLQVLRTPEKNEELPTFNKITNQWEVFARERVVTEIAGQKQETWIPKTIKAAHIINATGPGRNIHLDPLLNQMAKRGHIRQHEHGGIDVTLDGLCVINKNGNPLTNCWASGQSTVACNPAAAGSIEWNARDSERFARQAVDKLQKTARKTAVASIRSAI